MRSTESFDGNIRCTGIRGRVSTASDYLCCDAVESICIVSYSVVESSGWRFVVFEYHGTVY